MSSTNNSIKNFFGKIIAILLMVVILIVAIVPVIISFMSFPIGIWLCNKLEPGAVQFNGILSLIILGVVITVIAEVIETILKHSIKLSGEKIAENSITTAILFETTLTIFSSLITYEAMRSLGLTSVFMYREGFLFTVIFQCIICLVIYGLYYVIIVREKKKEKKS